MNKVEFKIKNQDKTQCGDLYLIDKEVYILSYAGKGKYILIGLKDGTRWDEIFGCKDENMTVDNIIAIIRQDDEEWDKSEVVYIGNKTIVVRD